MNVFVSYARRDNRLPVLREIATQISHLGTPYIDDLNHKDHSGSRKAIVEHALNTADLFVAVISENYLKTEWTRKEFDMAKKRGLPMFALLPEGRLVELGPGETSPVSLLRNTLASKELTANATELLTCGSKAIARVVLSFGVVLLAAVVGGVLVSHLLGGSPFTGVAVASCVVGALGGTAMALRRHATNRAARNSGA